MTNLDRYRTKLHLFFVIADDVSIAIDKMIPPKLIKLPCPNRL